MEEIRVLHIMNGAATGGISKVVLGICQRLVDMNYRFDIAIDDPKIGYSGYKLQELGCKLVVIPRRRQIIEYIRAIKTLVQNNNYDFVHIHVNESSTFPLFLTKIYGKKKVFVHMHTARKPKGVRDIINFLMLRISTSLLADKLIACSTEAGKAMYGERLCKRKEFCICKNYIDADKFSFNDRSREVIRNEINCDSETLLIGCVGNLREEKNHIFAIKIFEKLIENNDNAKLVIVGEGDKRGELLEYIADCRLDNKVFLVGNKDNVSDYLSSFDCCLMPSLYEGFGIAALEAIASGLPVIASEAITKDLNVFDNISYLSLEEDASEWAKKILLKSKNVSDRSVAVKIVKEKGFDYSSSKSDYRKMYEKANAVDVGDF